MRKDLKNDSAFDSIKNFYDNEYYGADTGVKEASPSWHSRVMARTLGDLRGSQVLDVACGRGEWLEWLQRQGATVAGVDLSERAIAACKLRMSDGEFHDGPAETLPFADDRFDVVTCLGSLEHFIDKPKALLEMRRVAKRNAKFLILVPNSGFVTRRLGLYKGTNQTKAREDVLSLDGWQSLFDAAGMRVDARFRDLHVLSSTWILRGSPMLWPFRLAQASALSIWPISWQYQVYHACSNKA